MAKRVVQLIFGLQHCTLNLGFQGGADTLEHQVEGGKLSNVVIRDLHGDLLKNTQHGAFPNGTGLTLEGIMCGEVLDSRLKQRELIGDKGITVDEMISILEIPVAW